MAGSRGKGVFVIAAGSVAAATFLVYIPALGLGFVNWDDPQYVYENPALSSLDLINFLGWTLTSVVAGNWHPLTMMSFGLDYSLWGLDPGGYHLTNVVLHVLNTVLVFFLGTKLFKKGGPDVPKSAVLAGAVSALLFGIHPLHVESVAWVSERKDVLSAFFFLLSVAFYLRYAGSSRKPCPYLLSLFFFALALMSKPMAVTLPLVLLVLDLYPLERFSRAGVKRVVLEKTPFFVLSMLTAAVTLWTQWAGEAVKTLEAVPLAERVTVPMRAYIFYIYKTVLPLNLAPFYPRPADTGFSSFWFLASLLLFLAITAFCVYTARRRRWYLAAWLYYVATLLPVIGIVQVGEQAAADRYMYLPSVSIFLLLGAGTGVFFERFSGRKVFPALAAGFWVLVFAALSLLTAGQIGIWKDSVTLWSYEIEAFPEGTYLAYYNRGLTYQVEGGLESAIKDYGTAIKLKPGHAPSYMNRGVVYGQTGRISLSLTDLEKAVELDPGEAAAYYNLALAYERAGNRVKAEENLRRARELGFR